MIVTVPNPVLTNPAKKVGKIDNKIRALVEKMKQVLIATDNPKGVGLAAPQIGIPLRIFLTHPTLDSGIDIFINPQIIWASKELGELISPNTKSKIRQEKKLEGCLSVSGVWGHLRRPKKIKVRYQDLEGKVQEKDFEGFMSTIIQHEADHLNGILFTQRVLEQKEKLYRIEEDEKGKEKLVEIEI